MPLDPTAADFADLLADAPGSAEEGAALLLRWSEPQRCYHDVSHLAAVLAHLALLDPVEEPAGGTAGGPAGGAAGRAARLGAWYHDAVYNPRAAGDNERRSADLAGHSLEALGAGRPVAEDVSRLVLLTAGHDPAPGDRAGALLCDADLAILGAPPADYQAYVNAVREEYRHLAPAAWSAGRRQVLESLAGRPHLFATELGRRRWEAPAYANLARELAAL